MNPQFLQVIQKVNELESNTNAYKLKIRALESQVNEMKNRERRPYSEFLPVGSIILFNGQKIPPGWSVFEDPSLTTNTEDDMKDRPVYIIKT